MFNLAVFEMSVELSAYLTKSFTRTLIKGKMAFLAYFGFAITAPTMWDTNIQKVTACIFNIYQGTICLRCSGGLKTLEVKQASLN